MKTIKTNSNGRFLIAGLNANEKKSLKDARQEFNNNDSYIVAYYCNEENEIYFSGENCMGTKAQIN